MARDWFKDQVQSLGAKTYTVNATGSQFATFDGENNGLPPIAMGSHLDSVATGGRFDGPLGVIGALEAFKSIKEQGIKTYAPIALINWTNEEGARFFPPLGSSVVYAGEKDSPEVTAAFESKANDGSGETTGAALESIGYVGDSPNKFTEWPISAHFEIHVEQQRRLEESGKPVGWVEGWQGIDYYEMTFTGVDGHANTYDMRGRADSLIGASKVMLDLQHLALAHGGITTVTNIQSGPIGACNIQSWTKVVFCVANVSNERLAAMGREILARAEAEAEQSGLGFSVEKVIDFPAGKFWPEAVDCVRRACGDRGIAADTWTFHDSSMTTRLCPTAMVFARAKDGVSHNPKEWTSKEDCAESALVLGRAVLNYDQILREKSV
ncbi:hypothetical protein PRZ48_003863 [Zasmidium cellare]|uniref:Uncharacterized protein n=1 Tax=Zasmidium cellare TaxID=395010 RepID=A0ABR0EYG8_ZASCE|nr:hypothetical protein PRZ48_003863 [Zasmidium cellare]